VADVVQRQEMQNHAHLETTSGIRFYTMNGFPIDTVAEEKDLGVVIRNI